jgi:hypothetical protein
MIEGKQLLAGYIPIELHKKIKAKADAHNVSMTKAMTDAMQKFLEDDSYPVHIKKKHFPDKKFVPNLPLPSQERLHELFDYNPDTGDLINKVDRSSIALKGQIVNRNCSHGCYRGVSVDNQSHPAHRIIYKWLYNEEPEDVDHLDHNVGNNRKNNLRGCTHIENCRNRSGAQSNSKSGVRGVYRHTYQEGWVVQITNGKKIESKYFGDNTYDGDKEKSLEAAKYHAKIKRLELFGDYNGGDE